MKRFQEFKSEMEALQRQVDEAKECVCGDAGARDPWRAKQRLCVRTHSQHLGKVGNSMRVVGGDVS